MFGHSDNSEFSENSESPVKATFHLTISMRGQREVSKTTMTGTCLLSFEGKTASLSFISHTHAQKIAD